MNTPSSVAMATKEQRVQLSVRVDASLIPRLDRIADALGRPGMPSNRVDAARYILSKCVDQIEAELGIKPAPAAKKGGAR